MGGLGGGLGGPFLLASCVQQWIMKASSWTPGAAVASSRRLVCAFGFFWRVGVVFVCLGVARQLLFLLIDHIKELDHSDSCVSVLHPFQSRLIIEFRCMVMSRVFLFENPCTKRIKGTLYESPFYPFCGAKTKTKIR